MEEKRRTKRIKDIKDIKHNMFGHRGCYCEAPSIVPLGHYAIRRQEREEERRYTLHHPSG